VVRPSRWTQVLAILSLGSSLMCATSRAQIPFSAPKNVSNNADFSLTPQVAVDGGGNIYAVWEDDNATNSNNSNILFSRSTDGGVTFSTPTNVSKSSGLSFSPRTAVDTNGGVNVVWVDNTPGHQTIFFSRSIDGGVTFSTPVNTSNDPSDSANPQIAVDATGTISVVWENDTINLGVFYAHSTDGGVSFSSPLPLTTNTSGSFGPQLAVDADGNICVVWEDDFSTLAHVSFSRSADKGATFSTPQLNLSKDSTGNSTAPMIALDGGGNINVVWVDDSPGYFAIFFTRSSDNGTTFSTAKGISNTSGNSANPQLAVDASGNVHVVWQHNTPQVFNRDIFFARSADGGATFTNPPLNLSANPGDSINPWLTVDSAGNLNLGWADTTPTIRRNILFSQSADAGVTFSAPQNLSNDSGGSSDVQIAADKNGNLDVVWSDGTSGINQILFSRFTNPKKANTPPVANAGPDQTLPATGPGGTSVTLDGSLSSDPDGDALTFVWTEGSTVVGNSAVVSSTVSMGVHTYTLTVTDTAGLSSTAVTHVTITNTPPVANAGPDQTLPAAGPAGTPVTLNGSASSDPDGDALTFVWTEGSTVVGKSAVASLNVTMGVHTYTLTVTDTAGLSSTATTHVTTTNTPPVANAGPDQTLPATGPTTPVKLNGSLSSDPDGDALTFVWTQGGTVVGNSAVVPLTLKIGTYTFTLTVTDTAGLSSTAVTHVTITNQPPVANAGPDQTLPATGPTTAVTLNGSLSSDPDGDALTFVWTQGGTAAGNSAVVPLTLKIGTYTFTLTVTDAGGLSSSAVTHVTITNLPPVANAGAAQTLPAAGPGGTSVTLNGSASTDPDGDVLTFVWTEGSTVVGKSAVVSLTASIGTHTYTLTVTDAGGLSSSAVTHVTITARPPVANAGPDQTLPAAGPNGTPVTLNGSQSSDPNGYALTFVWTQGGAVVGKSAVLPLTLNVGAYTFTLTVTDTAGLSSSAVTHVTITARPPVASVVADPTLECAGPGGTLVKLDGSASIDPNGYPLKFAWTDDSSGKIVGNSAVVWVMVSVGPLPHHYTLTVTDATTGLSSSAKTSVTVQDTLPPTLGVSLSSSARRLRDNKLVLVNATIHVSDVCDPNPKVKLISITSNDPADRGRHAVSDVEAVGGGPVAFGTDVRSFLLRAERPENRTPFVYKVTYSATDVSGNTKTTTALLNLSAR
jgi:phosphatidylethanolamine-binding protein (PEBP) family uncharacterized protein